MIRRTQLASQQKPSPLLPVPERPSGPANPSWALLAPQRHQSRATVYVLLVSTPIVAWLGDFAARHLPSVLGQFTAPAAVLAAFAVIIAGISFLEPAGQGAHSSLLRPARARRPRVRQ